MSRRVGAVTAFLAGLGVVIVALPAGAQSSGQIQVKQAEVDEASARLTEIQTEVGSAYSDYEDALGGLETINGEISSTGDDLIVVEKDLIEAQNDLDTQASRVYKSGNVGFLDVLMGVDSFSDFATRLNLWVRVLTEQREEVQRVETVRNDIATEKANLEEQRQERSDAVDVAVERRTEAMEQEAIAREYLGSLNGELRAAVEAQVFAEQQAADRQRQILAARQAEIAAQIQAQADEAARKAAEQQAAAEEAARQQRLAEQAAAEAEAQEAAEQAAAQEEAERQAEIAAQEQAAAEAAAAQAAAEQEAAEQAAAAEAAALEADQQAAADQAAADQAAADQAAADQAAADQAAADQAAADQAAADQAAADQAAADQAAADQAADQQYEEDQSGSVTDEGGSATGDQYTPPEQPGVDQGGGQPVAEEPVAEEPVAEQPAAEEPSLTGPGASANGPWQPHVASVADEVSQMFGVPATTYPGHSPSEDLAIDFMVGSDTALGQQIADHIAANADSYGISYAMWNDQFYSTFDNYNGSAYTWVQWNDGQHYDHVHVSFCASGQSGSYC